MDNKIFRIPVAPLLDPRLTASAKVVWMARQYEPSATVTSLEAHTGLDRRTVKSHLNQTAARTSSPGGRTIQVPKALLADRRVGSQAKVLYGLLQATPGQRGQRGQFTYAFLCSFTGLSRNTLKRSVEELERVGWIQLTQKNQRTPIHFTLGSPELRRSLAEAAEAARRLKRAKFGGEALMQEYLSLLIDSDQFTDNARPGFLVNPQTGERLELDRFYPPKVGFEFNGAQHYRATGLYSQEEAEAQYLRDLIKVGICVFRGVHLIIIHHEDLSLQGMIAKIGSSLPLRNLAGHEPLIDLLERASIAYQAAAGAAHRTGH